ncbi:hypothetical protein [Microscilla marina]|nr:hypothetical protein [Microscilla marina]
MNTNDLRPQSPVAGLLLVKALAEALMKAIRCYQAKIEESGSLPLETVARKRDIEVATLDQARIEESGSLPLEMEMRKRDIGAATLDQAKIEEPGSMPLETVVRKRGVGATTLENHQAKIEEFGSLPFEMEMRKRGVGATTLENHQAKIEESGSFQFETGVRKRGVEAATLTKTGRFLLTPFPEKGCWLLPLKNGNTKKVLKEVLHNSLTISFPVKLRKIKRQEEADPLILFVCQSNAIYKQFSKEIKHKIRKVCYSITQNIQFPKT